MGGNELANSPNGQKAISSGAVVQQVSTQYTTAVSVQNPRSLQRSTMMLEEEANYSGELFYYAWGEGKNAIEGPSVKLALAAVRCYGNCAVDMGEVQEVEDAWIFTARFVDLQTGYTLSRQFRQSKTWVVYGKHDEARKEDIRFQIGQSKAIRNVVLNAIPSFMVEKAMDAAKAGTRERLMKFINDQEKKAPGTGVAAAYKIILSGLMKHNVTEKMILEKLELASVAAIDVDRLITLRGNLNAIDRGEVTPEELYPASKQSTTEDLKKRLEDQKRATEEAKRKAEEAKTPPMVEELYPASKQSTTEDLKKRLEDQKRATEEAKRKAEEAKTPPMVEGEIPNDPPAETTKSKDKQKGKSKDKPKLDREPGVDDETDEDLTAGL